MYDDGLLLVSGGFNLIPLTAALRYPVAHSVVDGTLWGRGGGLLQGMQLLNSLWKYCCQNREKSNCNNLIILKAVSKSFWFTHLLPLFIMKTFIDLIVVIELDVSV